MKPSIATRLRRRPGRPRKFDLPSRAVTVTLPESVLETLSSVDPDVSRAIVRLASRPGVAGTPRRPAELAVFNDRAVITVHPTATLEKRTGVHLVPLPDGRALISFDQPQTIAELELLLHDALDDASLQGADRQVFEGVASILQESRRSANVAVVHRNIIVLEAARPAVLRGGAARRRTVRR